MTIYSGYLYTFGMRIWARFSREEPFPLGEAGAPRSASAIARSLKKKRGG